MASIRLHDVSGDRYFTTATLHRRGAGIDTYIVTGILLLTLGKLWVDPMSACCDWRLRACILKVLFFTVDSPTGGEIFRTMYRDGMSVPTLDMSLSLVPYFTCSLFQGRSFMPSC